MEISLSYFKSFFNKGHERTLKAKKNIALSFIFKILGILISFVSVPITINYISPYQYGVWITLSSIITWFSFFDIGLGNGLRNKLSIALSNKDYDLAKKYVSTTYALLILIFSGVIIVFQFINIQLNWSSILNCPQSMRGELHIMAAIVFTFFCLQLITQLINAILNATHAPAKISVLVLVSSALSLVFILVLKYYGLISLVYLGISITLPPFLVNIGYSLILFFSKFKNIRPDIRFIDFKYSKVLLALGSKFFFIQIAAIILYQTDNILISQLTGNSNVTLFNVAYKYLSIITMASAIILTPFWNSFTEAYTLHDIDWINRTFVKLKKITLVLSLIVVVLLIVSPFIYKIWVKSLTIPFGITLAVGICVIINMWNAIYSQFLNGTGKIMLQLYLGFGAAILNIPIAFFLGKIIGVPGIIISTAVVSIAGLFIYPIQFKKIMDGEAKGLWIR